jgi:flagellin-like hook-associated protein FlgL
MDEYVRTSTRSEFQDGGGVNFNGIEHMLASNISLNTIASRFWHAFSNQDAAGNWALNVERDELGQRFRVPDWRGPGDTVHMPGDYWDSVNTDPTSDRYGYGPDADGDGFFDGWGPWARIYSNFIGQNPRDVYERTRSGFSFAQLAVDHFLNEDIGDLVVGEFGATIRDFFSGGPLNLQVGPDSGHSIQVGIRGVSVARLGLSDLHVIDPEVGQGVVQIDQSLISAFLNDVDGALGMVSAERASLGAFQNRLEFTIENLNIAAENLSASESRIRDADMAREMMRLTQANVLQQAATAMLAQGNQAPQSILQLLG